MENTSWLKQTADKPLFADLLWSRPENKAQAGKLLIIGGNSHGFTTPANAYSAAIKAGVGAARVILPDKLQKTVGKLFPEADYAPSTPVGSFSRQSLAKLIDEASWADGALLAGDFGKNSETAVLLESFLSKYQGIGVLGGDSLDYFLESAANLLNRQNTAILADFGRLQALAKHNQPNPPLTHDMGLYELVKALAQWSKETRASLATHHQGNIAIATDGKVSTTPVSNVNLAELSAYMSVWLLQNPTKPFEALACAVV
jgi:hypothetical protein